MLLLMDIPLVLVFQAFFKTTLTDIKDFGVWNISYQAVPCEPDWAGAVEASALGSVSNLGTASVCCPANPRVSLVVIIEGKKLMISYSGKPIL